MKKNEPRPLAVRPAVLWDRQRQLSGHLELWEFELCFQMDAFKKSHLNWSIPLANIQKVEDFLVFGLARNGLRIEGGEGKYDLFVMEEVGPFKRLLLRELAKLNRKDGGAQL